jgi:hypothetical protein
MSVKDVHWDPQRIIGQPQADMLKARTRSISEHLRSAQCCQVTTVSSLGNQIKRRGGAATSIHFITRLSLSLFSHVISLYLTYSSKQTAGCAAFPSTDGGQEAAAGGYRLPVKAHPHCGFESSLCATLRANNRSSQGSTTRNSRRKKMKIWMQP